MHYIHMFRDIMVINQDKPYITVNFSKILLKRL